MGVEFLIVYEVTVSEVDIPNLPKVWQKKIRDAIRTKLMISPEVFGKPLRKSLKGYRKLRVGNYRVVFRIENETIKIFAILHRSVVYKAIQRRL